MSTVALVILAALAVFALLLAGLFGMVWFAGRSGQRAQLRQG